MAADEFNLTSFQYGGVDEYFGDGTYQAIRAEAGGDLSGLMNLAVSLGLAGSAARMLTDAQLAAFIANKRRTVAVEDMISKSVDEFDPTKLTAGELAIKNRYLELGQRLARDTSVDAAEVPGLVSDYINLGIQFIELLLAYPNLNSNYKVDLRSSLVRTKQYVGNPREFCLSVARDVPAEFERWTWLADQCRSGRSVDAEKKEESEKQADFDRRKQRARELLLSRTGDIHRTASANLVNVTDTGLRGKDHVEQINVNRRQNARIDRQSSADAGLIYDLVRELDKQKDSSKLWQWLRESLREHLMVPANEYNSCFRSREDGGGIDWVRVFVVFRTSSVVLERSKSGYEDALKGLQTIYGCFWR